MGDRVAFAEGDEIYREVLRDVLWALAPAAEISSSDEQGLEGFRRVENQQTCGRQAGRYARVRSEHVLLLRPLPLRIFLPPPPPLPWSSCVINAADIWVLGAH